MEPLEPFKSQGYDFGLPTINYFAEKLLNSNKSQMYQTDLQIEMKESDDDLAKDAFALV